MLRLGFGQKSNRKLRHDFVHHTPSVVRGRSVNVALGIQNHAAIGCGTVAGSFEGMKVSLVPFARRSWRQA